MLSPADRRAIELADTIRALAVCADDKWCSSVLLHPDFGDDEKVEVGSVIINNRAVAEAGEVVRVECYLFEDVAACRELCRLLIRDIEPFIIGVGEVRVVWNEALKLLVVFRLNPSLVSRGHEVTPEMIDAGLAHLLRFHRERDDDEDVVTRLYRAMRALEISCER